MHQEQDQAGIITLLRAQLNDPELYPVHRLDKITSGALIVGRGKDATRKLSNLFEHHQIQKYYLALSDKKPRKKQGGVIGDMHTARNGCWKLSREHTRPAVTHFFSYAVPEAPGLRLYLLKPATGKTHQLRVAMKSLAASILGDSRYSGTASDRSYLHAYKLMFEYDGKPYSYQVLPTIGELFLKHSASMTRPEIEQPQNLDWPSYKPSQAPGSDAKSAPKNAKT